MSAERRSPPDLPGRFNFFQRMMLRWRELHPYNPVHVLRLPLPLHADRLRAVIAAQLQAQGLSGLRLERRRWRYGCGGGAAAEVELRIVDGSADPAQADATLARCIEEEFNRPFAAGPHENPFRFVAVDEHGAFRLALAYDHYVAGGEAIARLLTRLAGALLDEDAPAPPPPLPAHDAARYRQALWRHPAWALRALLDLPRWIGQARRTCRVRFERADDRHNHFRSLQIAAPQTQALRTAAGEWGVTLHELLSACLLLALSPLVPRRAGARRQQLAVASIMNMRRDLAPAQRRGLSPFLAAYRVAHCVPPGMGLRQLAADVHRQTQRVKRGHLYLQSLMGLALSALAWPWQTPRQRDGFYPKHFPVQAGISSIDLNRLWADDGAAALPIGYLRAVPTGPLCPLVLALTEAHDELQLGLAWRRGAFTPEAVEQLAVALLRHAALRPEAAA